MLKTPSCCCLALDVLAWKDLLKSSFIAEIPSSHNSFLKTLTGSIMQSSPQDALSHTRGAAWLRARWGESVPVLVCLLSLGLFLNISHTTQAVFRGFTHQWNFCTALFQREPFLIESMTVTLFLCLGKAWLVRDLLHGNGEQWFGQRSPVVCWECLVRSVKQHVDPADCLGMKKHHTATQNNSAVFSTTWTVLQRGIFAISVWHTVPLYPP